MSTRKSALKRSSIKSRRPRRHIEIHESKNEIFTISPNESLKKIGFKEKSNDPENEIKISRKKSNIIIPVETIAVSASSAPTPKTIRSRFMSLFTRRKRGGGMRKKRVGVYTRKSKGSKGSNGSKTQKNSLDRPLSDKIRHKPIFHKGFADATKYGEEF